MSTLYQLSQSGVEAGYGVAWALVKASPPRDVRAAYTDSSTPAAAAGIGRGAKVLKVGNLQPSRDYLHVRTAAEAYWRLIGTKASYGRVVNVCSGIPTRMGDIVASGAVIATGSPTVCVG